MTGDLIHSDFTQRVALATGALPWIASPQPGVERRMLDRIGGEVARATSLVRYAPASVFPAHTHGLGEEFLVLEGVFSDERGDYPKGTYVRNPPGSSHTPRTAPGCIILVKLRQMPLTETQRIVVDTTTAAWNSSAVKGHTFMPLYTSPETGETVAIEKLEAGTRVTSSARGEEIFVLSGDLSDENGDYSPGFWIRNPPGSRNTLRSRSGATYWVKRVYLRPEP